MNLMKVTMREGLTPIETNRAGLELKGKKVLPRVKDRAGFLQVVADWLGVLGIVQEPKGSACGRTAYIALHPLALAAEWAIAKTRRAMTAFNLEPTPENKRSARAWAKRLDYELAKHTN